MKRINFYKRNVLTKILSGLGLIMIVAGLQSCKHDNFKEFVGEAICPGKNFTVLQPFQVSSNNIDLNFGGLVMTAGFSETAKWTITITGQTSGAKRVYSGKSSSVNVTWYGQPGNMTFFKNETVTVKFEILCLPDLNVTENVTITKNNFNTFGGVLVSDFEGNGSVTNTTTMGYNASGWSSYASPGTTYNSFTVTNTPLTPPTTPNYLHIDAQPGATSWWSGGVYGTISLSSLPTSHPDSIYFNAFIYGHPTTSLTISLVGPGGPFNRTLNLGTWTGWKYITYKLSDVGVVNPLTLNALEFGFGPATEAGQPNQVNVDFVIFTAGEPFLQEY
jgi:hypothetical protein